MTRKYENLHASHSNTVLYYVLNESASRDVTNENSFWRINNSREEGMEGKGGGRKEDEFWPHREKVLKDKRGKKMCMSYALMIRFYPKSCFINDRRFRI